MEDAEKVPSAEKAEKVVKAEKDARARMIRSAVVLLARKGYQGASFSEVLAHSGAPRGSIYHHFPHGKDELIAAAVEAMGAQAAVILDALAGSDAAGVVDGFVAMWRTLLTGTGYQVGCSIAGVTVTAGSEELLDRAAAVFRRWTAKLAELLRGAGLAESDAADFATMLVAATEGAVVLARAERSLAPLEAVQRQLRRLAEGYGAASTTAD